MLGIQAISRHRQFVELIRWAMTPLQPMALQGLTVVDVTMPELEETVASIVNRGYRVLVYGGVLHSSRVLHLVSLGVRGYVTETALLQELRTAANHIATGGTYLPFDPPSDLPRVQLTASERAAADAYFLDHRGLPRAEVAKRLGIAESTLRNQLASVRRKLGAEPRMSRAGLSRRYRAICNTL